MSEQERPAGSLQPAWREAPPQPGARRLSSTSLFGGREEIVIVHSGQDYRLRITKADKLILTK
jgi:hemin uptake protein HemP